MQNVSEICSAYSSRFVPSFGQCKLRFFSSLILFAFTQYASCDFGSVSCTIVASIMECNLSELWWDCLCCSCVWSEFAFTQTQLVALSRLCVSQCGLAFCFPLTLMRLAILFRLYVGAAVRIVFRPECYV